MLRRSVSCRSIARQRCALLVAQKRLLGQRFGEHPDTGERRLELVRHLGQEVELQLREVRRTLERDYQQPGTDQQRDAEREDQDTEGDVDRRAAEDEHENADHQQAPRPGSARTPPSKTGDAESASLAMLDARAPTRQVSSGVRGRPPGGTADRDAVIPCRLAASQIRILCQPTSHPLTHNHSGRPWI